MRGVDVKPDLIALSDEAWGRTRARLEGLTDDEYLWEPVPGCWSVRRRDDGRWAVDQVLPSPTPEPLTTIAWRLWHLIDMYGEDRAPRWLDVPPQGPAIGLDDPDGEPPGTAAEAIALLERAHDRWDAHLAQVTEEQLAQEVGPVAGPYAEATRAGYVLHMLDEFVHHGAELSLLRDLWRWQVGRVGDDRVLERVARGDLSVIDDLDGTPPAGLVEQAAAYARWELVLALLSAGAPVATTGRTALHLAAGNGEVEATQALLDHGADPSIEDPDFHATPLVWAEFREQPAAAEVLRRAGAEA